MQPEQIRKLVGIGANYATKARRRLDVDSLERLAEMAVECESDLANAIQALDTALIKVRELKHGVES